MPFIELPDKLRTHYLDFSPAVDAQPPNRADSQKTVVLLHGLGANAYSWLLQIPTLVKSGFRVLAPDFRGFGASSYPGGSVSVGVFSKDLRNFLFSKDLKSINLVGLSLGGMVALQFSIDYPEYVDRLVLINTAARLIPAGISVGMYFGLRFILGLATNVEFQAPIIAQSLLPGDDYRLFREYLVSQITESDSRAYRRTILSLASFNELGRLAQIKSPTLVVTGENDSTIPPALQKRMADRISGSLQKQVPKAGHAIIVQRPDEVNHLLGNFLRS